jgi:hypothetical protein
VPDGHFPTPTSPTTTDNRSRIPHARETGSTVASRDEEQRFAVGDTERSTIGGVVVDRGSRAMCEPRKGGWWLVVAVALMSLVVVLAAAAGSSADPAQTASAFALPPTVGCDKSIDNLPPDRRFGYRVVLGAVAVPPAFLPQVVATPGQSWPFWRKAGLVVRAGSPVVVVSVPNGWRKRAAISWGNSGPVSVLRLASCPPPLGAWNAYAGGFLLQASSACVPLNIRVGQRSTTVRFGLGRSCP